MRATPYSVLPPWELWGCQIVVTFGMDANGTLTHINAVDKTASGAIVGQLLLCRVFLGLVSCQPDSPLYSIVVQPPRERALVLHQHGGPYEWSSLPPSCQP